MQAVNICCPGCGEPWTLDMKECPSCHRPVVITTFNSVYSMPGPEANKYANTYRRAIEADADAPGLDTAIAMCYLKLGLYAKGLEAFERAVEEDFDNSETYFYAAVCLLGGKKAFLATRDTINRIEEYINAACMIEPRGIYRYFHAYIKYDYYERKYLNTSPTWQQCLEEALNSGVSDADITMLFDVLKVSNPFAA